jgi:hypothetical protein
MVGDPLCKVLEHLDATAPEVLQIWRLNTPNSVWEIGNLPVADNTVDVLDAL